MSDYLLTPEADADLEAVWRHVATESGVAAADRLEAKLHAAMKRLARMPGMGHVRQDLADEPLRFISVSNRLVIYRSETRPIQIIRVLHGARDVRAILDSM